MSFGLIKWQFSLLWCWYAGTKNLFRFPAALFSAIQCCWFWFIYYNHLSKQTERIQRMGKMIIHKCHWYHQFKKQLLIFAENTGRKTFQLNVCFFLSLSLRENAMKKDILNYSCCKLVSVNTRRGTNICSIFPLPLL